MSVRTFEELNGMTKVQLIEYAGQKHVANFKKSSKKEVMIEAICTYVGCVRSRKEEREARSRSRSRSSSKSGRSGASSSRSPSPSKLKNMGIGALKTFVKDKKLKIKGITSYKSADKEKLVQEILKILGKDALPESKPKSPKKKVKDGKEKKEKKCKDDEELNDTTGRCRKKCKDGEERDASGKCKKAKVSDKKPKKCNPEGGEFCDDNEDCYIPSNVCHPKDKRDSGWDEIDMDGKKIVGSKDAISSLRGKLFPSQPSAPLAPSPAPYRPRSPSPPPFQPPTPPQRQPLKPQQRVDDISAILKELQDDDDLSNLDDFQRDLIQCLFKSK